MMKMLRKKRKGGFTLIELIVVIAILGILALIAIPRFAGIQDSAKLKADHATAAQMVNMAKIIAADLNITLAQAVGTAPASGDWTPLKAADGTLSNGGTQVYMTIPVSTQSVPGTGFTIAYVSPTFTVSGPSTSYTSN